MSVLILIPARAGSKRVKNKNIRLINNKPLIYWSIIFAKKLKKKIANLKIVVTSDCPKILKISKSLNEMVIERPANIARNKTSMYSVINQALKKLDKFNNFKFIVLLQPTSPMRKISWVLKGLNLLKKESKFENLIHLSKTNKYIGRLKKNKWVPEFPPNKRSQDINNHFEPSGCLFIYKMKNFENKKKFNKRSTFGYVTNDLKTVNIDYEEDFILLNYYLNIKKFKIIN